jgi:hypothetical protein
VCLGVGCPNPTPTRGTFTQLITASFNPTHRPARAKRTCRGPPPPSNCRPGRLLHCIGYACSSTLLPELLLRLLGLELGLLLQLRLLGLELCLLLQLHLLGLDLCLLLGLELCLLLQLRLLLPQHGSP